MNELPEKFDEELKRRLFDYKQGSPPGLWEKIALVIPGIAGNESPRPFKTILTCIIIISLLSIQVSDSNMVTVFDPHEKLQRDDLVRNLSGLDIVGSNSVKKKNYICQTQRDSNIAMIHRANVMLEGAESFSKHGEDKNVFKKNYSVAQESDHIISHELRIQPQTKFDEDDLSNTIHQSLPEKRIESNLTNNGSTKSESTAALRKLKREKEEITYHKFKMYFTAMPTFGYQRVKSNGQDNIFIEKIKHLPVFSMKRLGVRAEFGAELPISKKINAFGGLLYYQRKQTISYVERVIDTTYLYIAPDGNVGIESEFDHLDKSFEYDLKNLGIQIGLNILLSKDIVRQTLGTGIEFQWALNKINPSTKKGGFSQPSAYVFYNLYYRVQYPAEGRLKAVLQPTFNYSMYISKELHAPFYVKPYGLGINIGCTYSF